MAVLERERQGQSMDRVYQSECGSTALGCFGLATGTGRKTLAHGPAISASREWAGLKNTVRLRAEGEREARLEKTPYSGLQRAGSRLGRGPGRPW
jgi:hypothetical protein